MSKPAKFRRLSANEWLLIVAIAMGILMVALRWDYISSQIVSAVRAYFAQGQ